MRALRRSRELMVIMLLGWITMLLTLIAIDRIIIPISLPKPNYLFAVLEGLIKLVGASMIALLWLLLWRMMIERYKVKRGEARKPA